MKPTDPPVLVERNIDAPIEKVWKAITDVSQMRDWFFAEIPEFDPSIGFETQFEIEHNEKVYKHQWKLLEADTNKRIVIDWQYEHCDGKGLVEWELSESDNGTSFKVTNSVVESFPEDDPAFERESCEGGWEYLMDSLKDYVESV